MIVIVYNKIWFIKIWDNMYVKQKLGQQSIEMRALAMRLHTCWTICQQQQKYQCVKYYIFSENHFAIFLLAPIAPHCKCRWGQISGNPLVKLAACNFSCTACCDPAQRGNTYMLNCKINGTVNIFFLKKSYLSPRRPKLPQFLFLGEFSHHILML